VTGKASLSFYVVALLAQGATIATSLTVQQHTYHDTDYNASRASAHTQVDTMLSTTGDAFDGCSYFQFGPVNSADAVSPPTWLAGNGPRTGTFRITVTMRTTDSDGLLLAMYSTELHTAQQGFVVMEIVQGGKVRAALSSNTPACGIREVTSAGFVNDGETHTITLDRYTGGDSFTLDIDGTTASLAATGCGNIELDNMWVGGLPSSIVPRASLGDSQSSMSTAVTSTSNFAGVIDSVIYAAPNTGTGTDVLPTTEAMLSVGGGCTTESTSDTSATGDPHLQNVLGERFDLMRPGMSVLINIPRGTSVESALLVVQANARHLGKQCSDVYFQELNVTGAWADVAQRGGFHFHAHDVFDGKPTWMKLGPVGLKIVHGHSDMGVQYLNIFVKYLGRAGFPVGGLLGEDDHTEAEKHTASCQRTMSFSNGVQKVMQASVAKAYS